MSPFLLTAACPDGVSTELAGDLVQALGSVPDPRPGGYWRHPLGYVLAVTAAAFACAGFESFVGAAQWAAGASRQVLLGLGAAPDPLTGAVYAPSEATIRRVATGVDATALEAVVALWTAARVGCAGGAGGDDDGDRVAVAVDGKTVRGAKDAGRRAPHLLAAATHHRPVVLAQRQVPGKTNEIPMVATLLEDLKAAGHDPASMVFTLDALHTQHATARLLHDAGAGYVMTVKGNQPSLLAAVCDQVSAAAPVPQRTKDRGHGRTEERLIAVAPAASIDFPGAAQVFRITRHTGALDGQRTSKEVVHGITNLTTVQAGPPQVATLVRGHWSIENSTHYVRDVTFGEDASRVRTGNAPAVLAAIRNIVTTTLRLAAAVNIAAARRAASLDPTTMIQLFRRPRNQDKRPP